MKPLVIVEKSPLPAISGIRLRILHLLRGVAATADSGDLVVLAPIGRPELELLAEELPRWTITSVPVRKRSRDLHRRLRWLRRRDVPTQLAVLDLDAAADAVVGLLGGEPRLLVAMHASPIAVARRIRRPMDRLVYDLNDAEDLKLVRSVDEGQPSSRRGPGLWPRLRNRIDVRAWRTFQAEAVAASDLSLVCSELDLERFSGFGNAVVAPNGTEVRSTHAVGRDRNRLLFVGQLSYRPNERAAIRLAERVLPLVRSAVPEATVRLVGTHGAGVSALRARPGVEVTGFVEDLDPEWAQAAMLVVPLTSGGGTRLKILDALGRGVPVVSTTIGAEGIAGIDGIHFRLADTDAALAAAVVALLQDPRAADAMAARGQELVRERYQWSSIERQLADELRRIAR